MIPFSLQPEPAAFDADVRRKGLAWLQNTPGAAERRRPHPHWRPCLPDLRTAFRGLCGYAAMRIDCKGSVDHFKSWNATRATQPELAYEWSNFRFCSTWINAVKKEDAAVLDPFVVQNGWFRIVLPTMELETTAEVPDQYRNLAQQTLDNLHLRDDEDLVDFRREWYEAYKSGDATFGLLEEWAPLVAMAVKDLVDAGKPLP